MYANTSRTVPGEVAVDEGDGDGRRPSRGWNRRGAPQAEAVLVGVRGGDGRWDEGGDRRADPAEEDGDARIAGRARAGRSLAPRGRDADRERDEDIAREVLRARVRRILRLGEREVHP